MSKIPIFLIASTLVCSSRGDEAPLGSAEVRLPYPELAALLAKASAPAKAANSEPALLSARFRLMSAEPGAPMEAVFRVASFQDDLATIPLMDAGWNAEVVEPADAKLIVRDGKLAAIAEKAGVLTMKVRLDPLEKGSRMSLNVADCPSRMLETGDLGAEGAVELSAGGTTRILGSGQTVTLAGTSEIRLLGAEEVRDALRPPEPSDWRWQHQVLVTPSDASLYYAVMATASATGGSGVSAELALPADARNIKVSGGDIAEQRVIRGADRSQKLMIQWMTRGTLDRDVEISYQMPRRPLDRKWRLEAPASLADDAPKVKFIISGSPLLAYVAEGLLGPLPAQGLPAPFLEALKNSPTYQLEGGPVLELGVNPLPVVAAAEATLTEASWMTRIEPDGAMLTEGLMVVSHKGGNTGVRMEIPAGMSLLACSVNGASTSPVMIGEGVIEIPLPPERESTNVECSFTSRTEALDPVDGTVAVSLPKTPLFIRGLLWRVELPAAYQAEVHGNVTRVANQATERAGMITTQKKLCRDEKPEMNVFYQRADLKR